MDFIVRIVGKVREFFSVHNKPLTLTVENLARLEQQYSVDHEYDCNKQVVLVKNTVKLPSVVRPILRSPRSPSVSPRKDKHVTFAIIESPGLSRSTSPSL